MWIPGIFGPTPQSQPRYGCKRATFAAPLPHSNRDGVIYALAGVTLCGSYANDIQ